ncbi:MAG: hypothetical protein LBL45_02630 [Treponema sp.]|nr:hypothetical protein [Treponema sp.]
MLDINVATERIEGKGGLTLSGKLAEIMGIQKIASPITKDATFTASLSNTNLPSSFAYNFSATLSLSHHNPHQ